MNNRQCVRQLALVGMVALGWTLIGCVPPPDQKAYTSSSTTSSTTTGVNTTFAVPYGSYEESSYDPSPVEMVPAAVTDAGVPESSSDHPWQESASTAPPDAPTGTPTETPTDAVGVAPPAEMPNLVPIDLQLPAPAFRGTPVPMEEPNVEKPRGEPRPPFFAPEGTANLALGKTVVCSDPIPTAGEVDLVTDGDKEASDFGCLELRPGSEWVQIDLEQKSAIYAVVLWHNHAEARVYRDVVVQVSDDPDFLDATTVFNNDYDNSSGLGIGSDMGYVETSEGKLIDCRGVEGRFVRLYSHGNTVDGKNHYTEVAVYGRPIP